MNLFVYGTLMIPEVIRGLGLTPPTFLKGSMEGFFTARLEGFPYPLLVVDPEGKLQGQIWRNVTPSTMEVLREYEGVGYTESKAWAHDLKGRKWDCSIFIPLQLLYRGWEIRDANVKLAPKEC